MWDPISAIAAVLALLAYLYAERHKFVRPALLIARTTAAVAILSVGVILFFGRSLLPSGSDALLLVIMLAVIPGVAGGLGGTARRGMIVGMLAGTSGTAWVVTNALIGKNPRPWFAQLGNGLMFACIWCALSAAAGRIAERVEQRYLATWTGTVD